MQKRDLISIRPGVKADEAMIYSSWLKGLRYGNSWFEQIEQESYFETYHRVINQILHKPDVQVRVACLKEDEDVILGYSVSEPQLLHWVFVKPDWRRIGLARDLVAKDITTVTHMTKLGKLCKPDHVNFKPFF
jgi:hypothetical protein